MQKFLNGRQYYIKEFGLDETSQLSPEVLLPVLYRLIPMGLQRIVAFGDPAQLNLFGSSDGR
jgi:hypothetical protein